MTCSIRYLLAVLASVLLACWPASAVEQESSAHLLNPPLAPLEHEVDPTPESLARPSLAALPARSLTSIGRPELVCSDRAIPHPVTRVAASRYAHSQRLHVQFCVWRE
jgi:hypothetical protein